METRIGCIVSLWQLVDIKTVVLYYASNVQNCWLTQKFHGGITSAFGKFTFNTTNDASTCANDFCKWNNSNSNIHKAIIDKMEQYQIGGRFMIESVQLKTVNGQILHIFDGELYKYQNGHLLILIVANKMDRTNWFTILIGLDSSNKFIWRLEFSKKKLEYFDDIEDFITEQGGTLNGPINQNGNKLKAKSLCWTGNLDIFLRRGAAFTKFRHFKIKEFWDHPIPIDYADFLVSYISKTKHADDFLESIEMNLKKDNSPSIREIWEYCHKGIGEGFDKKKLHILSAKTTKLFKDFSHESVEYSLEFTLANLPTNGAYVFDVEVKSENEFKQIAGIKIQKRKIDEIVELKCKIKLIWERRGRQKMMVEEKKMKMDRLVLEK